MRKDRQVQRTQQDRDLHLDGVEELQLGARAVPGGVHAKGVGRAAGHGQALAVRRGAQGLVKLHAHAVVDLQQQHVS